MKINHYSWYQLKSAFYGCIILALGMIWLSYMREWWYKQYEKYTPTAFWYEYEYVKPT